MHGRTRSCLFAILSLILAPRLVSQSDRAHPAPDFLVPPSLPYPAQPPVRPPPQPPVDGRFPRPPHLPVTTPGTLGFPQIVQAAGTVFSGTVTAITSHAANVNLASRQTVPTVSITFHVERAIRGVIPGENFTISQWMGAWSGGQRYRIGDRALLFLYPNSKVGLTSCVGGPIGRFRIDPLGRVLLSAQQLSAFRADPLIRGRSRIAFNDFAQAVDRARGEESEP